MHPLENPFIWLLFQIVEILIAGLLLNWLFPRSWPLGVQIALSVAVVVGLTWFNYRVRKRFIPR
jgi:hypothetical protein